MNVLRARWRLLATFVVSFAYVWWLAGDRLILTNDEGIYLSHAARIADGEVLYRDLFALSGPASYWLLALVFKIAGISLISAHLILATQIAVLATMVYFITTTLSDVASGVIAAFVFLILNAADPAMMTNNHRWDADVYAICGIVAIWRGRTFVGGFLLAISAWATPIFAVTGVTAALGAMLVRQSPIRIIAGGACGTFAGLAALYINGSLSSFWQSLLWMKDNYSDVNRMSYGSIIGGYPALFEGASGIGEWTIRALIVVGVTIPVWLPLLCGVILLRNYDRNRVFLFICGVSMIAGVSPRYDVGHLIFAAPLFYPLAASFIPKVKWAIVPVLGLTFLFLISSIIHRVETVSVSTRFGNVRTDPNSAEVVRWLTNNIHSGEKIFVYPYPPIAYLLTRGQNVSRFCYLHPGLFTVAEELIATEELSQKPPSKVLFMNITEDELLRMWPASDPKRLQLNTLHNFVLGHFSPGPQFRSFQIYLPRTLQAAD